MNIIINILMGTIGLAILFALCTIIWLILDREDN